MLNNVIFQGRFVAKPEVKDAGGFSLSEFTIAWSEKIGERENKCFLRCKAWRGTAEFIEKYFDKGQEIIVEGKLLTEQWGKDGQTQSRVIMNVEHAHFSGKKAEPKSAPSTDNSFMQLPDGDEEKLPFD